VSLTGMVYFSESHFIENIPSEPLWMEITVVSITLKTYNPYNGQVNTVFSNVESASSIQDLLLDSQGNIFYDILTFTRYVGTDGSIYFKDLRSEIHERAGITDTTLASIPVTGVTEPTASMDLDYQGNLYYIIQAATGLYKIPAGKTQSELIVDLPGSQHLLRVLGGALYVSALENIDGDLHRVRIYKYTLVTKALSILQERTELSQISGQPNFSSLSYFASNSKGDLYYFLRNRAQYRPDPSGYLEVDFFSSKTLSKNGAPSILISENQGDDCVNVYSSGNRGYLSASSSGDVFVHFLLSRPEDPDPTVPSPLVFQSYLYWYNPRTGTYSTLLHYPYGATVTTSLDSRGNLYCALASDDTGGAFTGTLLRINA
ncbi:hypothetical protein MUP37_03105, partial [Candidatus Bathyarchaeota archaeon]|nr:hypothetical protein [Candidatus Bathyarchaeota archaeon]